MKTLPSGPITVHRNRAARDASAWSAPKVMLSRVPSPSSPSFRVMVVVYSTPSVTAVTTVRRGGSDSVTVISWVSVRPNMVRVSRQELPGP